jgi:hypothetical protein
LDRQLIRDLISEKKQTEHVITIFKREPEQNELLVNFLWGFSGKIKPAVKNYKIK